MTDPVGVTLGAVGLAALFTTCLDVWDFVDAGKAHASNFSLLRTKLDNQRILFIIWGKKLGFGSLGGYNKRLDDPFIAPAVEANLNHIQRIFSETDTLVKRYGIKIITKESSGIILRPAVFESNYNRFLNKLRRHQKQTSFWNITRWSIRDEKKFDVMVKDLAELVEGLDRITQAFSSHKDAEKLAEEEVSGLDDLTLLEEIQEATGDVATIVSSAASIRHRTLEGRTIMTMSTLGSFRTAPTHASKHTREPLADTKYIDSLIDSGGDMSLGTTEKTNLSTDLPKVATQAESESRNSSKSQMMMDQIISANKAALQEALQTLPMSPSSMEITAATSSLQLSRRLVRELSWQRLENSKYFTFAPLDSLREYLATIKGPDGTPYENGIFHIRMSIPEHYPMVPPKCWYLTKVYHPNIDSKGAICLDLLQSNYTPALTLTTIIITICALLDNPNPDDPVMPEIARQMIDDKPLFEKTAREWARLYATGEIIYQGTRVDGFCNTFS